MTLESGELVSRLFVFRRTRDQKAVNSLLDFIYFDEFVTRKCVPRARRLALFTLTTERRKHLAPFWIFGIIGDQIGLNLFSVFGFFEEFDTIKISDYYWLF